MESADVSSKDTSVVVIVLETSEVYIIISLSTRNDTQVIYVDPTTGLLCYFGKQGLDFFGSEEEALNYVTDGSRLVRKSTTNARAILGYAALGNLGVLLVATKVNATIPDLPGGGCVYTVTESQWIKIPLQNPQPQGKGELKNVQELTEVDIDGKHYFCETRDITRPFPSAMTCHNPDDEFVWNGWFSKSFRDIGLAKHCVVLLQGFAECRSIIVSGQEARISLLARRSRLHPGTRYLARGLNSCSSTGNEVECEQVVWVPGREKVPFSSYIWRRGTVPIWWGAELKLSSVDAEIYVAAHNPYRGSVKYYQRLSKRYGARDPKLSTVGQDKTPLVPIVCINLLRYAEGKPESILVEHFEKSLKYIKSTGKLTLTWIQLINYDWHATVKAKGEQKTIEGLWELLKAPTIDIGFCEGSYFSSAQSLKQCEGIVVCGDDFEGGFCLKTLQNGVIRFNCADSLDRTNAASYFGSVQVLVEQCRRLGISLNKNAISGCSSESPELDNDGGKNGSLPPGWEEKSDADTGKPYYIDNNTNRMTWLHPCVDNPWKRFEMPFDQFKSSTVLAPINHLAELFLLAGDIHATLYTGSKAMHSQILNVFSDEGGGKYNFSVAQNFGITLQRRYQNVVVDGYRQKQLEMFLGTRLFKHLPSVPVHPLKVLTRPLGWFLKPIPSILPVADGGSSLLSFKRKDFIWVCPPAADVVEVFIYLGEPCHVTDLLLTVSHGRDDSSYPGTVDIRTGCDLDGLKFVLEGACIPQCSNKTNLLIPLTGRINPEDIAIYRSARHNAPEKSCLPLLYDFEELEGEINFLTRIVALTFYPSAPGRTPLTLGEIEVLGVSLPWMDIFGRKKNGDKLVSYRGEHKHSSAVLGTSDSSSEPLNSSVTEGACSSNDRMIDFSDTKQSTGDSDSTSQSYSELFKSISTSKEGNQVDFVQAMKLEIERLRINLSAAERDKALFAIGTDPSSVDPNCLLDELYLVKLCNYASNLALLGQTSFEDLIIASSGLDITTDNNVIDFWNISNFRAKCIDSTCEVQIEVDPAAKASPNISPTGSSPSLLECSKCGRKTCKFCCAGKGASLLLSSNDKDMKIYNGVANLSESSDSGYELINASHSDLSNGVICKLCCDEIVLHALYVDYIRVLSSLRRQTRADTAARRAVDHVVGHDFYKMPSSSQDQQTKEELLNGEESLAEFPYASLLHSVETAASSEPLMSLLAPIGIGTNHSYWRAPSSCSSAEFSIVLGGLSDVSGVALFISSCGYSTYDCPVVEIWTSNTLRSGDRSYMGKWDIKSLISSSSSCHSGQEQDSSNNYVPKHVKFSFSSSTRCRIIWMTLTLPPITSSLISEEQSSNDISSPKSSSDEIPNNERFIHARRILVFGKSVKIDTSPEDPEMMKMKSFLDGSPLLGRFKVPIESEKLTANNLVLEQNTSPNIYGIAGFRLDVLNVIKPRITHSPLSSDLDIWQSSLTRLEDAHISPALLYIHVSVVEETSDYIVGEYRLPEVKAGTSLYFDFPRPIQAKRIIFRLCGDVASFADDTVEKVDSNAKALPLASGMSLSNRIKLYYYADPYEQGKLASLSAV